jgi:flagellar motor switch protein FliG
MKQGIKLGGVATAARILNRVKVTASDQLLSDMADLDVGLALQVIDEMTRFEELAAADTRSLQRLVREVEAGVLMVALMGCHKPVRDAFLSSMSSRARERFVDDMNNIGATRRSDIEVARKEVVRCARCLSEANEFALPSEDYVR